MTEAFNYKPQFKHDDVEILERSWIYRGFVQLESVTLRHRLFKDQSFGPELKREMTHRREAAGVFVHDPKLKKFLLIEQFRLGAFNSPVSPWQLEIIAGLIDEGEDAETCLRRESLEEAGCTLQDIKFLYRYFPSTGACDEIFSMYVATADLSQAGGVFGAKDEGEDIKVHIFDYADVTPLMQSGHVSNAALVIALQWLQQFLSLSTNSISKDQ